MYRTKRMIVDVLKVQPGETLTEILETPATEEQVTAFWRQVSLCNLHLFLIYYTTRGVG